MNAKKPTARFETAMLIDDNEIDNLINEKMLEGTNFAERIYVYTSGKSALEYLQNLQRDKILEEKLIPDVIFLDINMPLMDGFQFLDEFDKLEKVIAKKSKIVMLTTSINPSDRELSDSNKYVLSFINKPLTQDYLEDVK
jgi:CheY-like chemotaxis protein